MVNLGLKNHGDRAELLGLFRTANWSERLPFSLGGFTLESTGGAPGRPFGR